MIEYIINTFIQFIDGVHILKFSFYFGQEPYNLVVQYRFLQEKKFELELA
jgi:hypothetical protein